MTKMVEATFRECNTEMMLGAQKISGETGPILSPFHAIKAKPANKLAARPIS
jgi:hypothetical protein